ncbi:MAG: RCC1 domain-containing protein [Acidimicrobiia bacterium]
MSVLTGATAVAADDANVCALLKAGTVTCWDALGYDGDGTTNYAAPVSVKGINGKGLLSGVTALSAGGESACALTTSETVKCWGQNDYGVLGNGTIKDSVTPVSVTGLRKVTSVSISAQVACASLQNGTVKCWGYVGSGELGVPPNGQAQCPFGEFSAPCSKIPTTVKGVSDVTSVSAAQNHVCALLRTETVECWGANSVTPVVVTGLTDVKALSTDGSGTTDRTCALLEDGTVKCLAGYDTNTYKPSLVNLAGLSGVTFVALGDIDDCAVLSVGIIKCWEDNNVTKTAPVTVTGL